MRRCAGLERSFAAGANTAEASGLVDELSRDDLAAMDEVCEATMDRVRVHLSAASQEPEPEPSEEADPSAGDGGLGGGVEPDVKYESWREFVSALSASGFECRRLGVVYRAGSYVNGGCGRADSISWLGNMRDAVNGWQGAQRMLRTNNLGLLGPNWLVTGPPSRVRLIQNYMGGELRLAFPDRPQRQ